ncbi:MAG: TetR/AcrR family transcriptional regulator [Lachnospiraceae bacterium]|nr:TetR/AcrR family transcriptional regulator [Lachnospiraceae bacterium]
MDLRTIKTEELIENTFYELLKAEDFAAISIKQITEKARINRSTFYRHFEDKFALRDFIIDNIVKDFEENMDVEFMLFSDLESKDYIKHFKESLEHLKENKEKYEILWSSLLLGRNVFEEMISAGVEKMQKSILSNKKIKKQRKERAQWYAYLLVNNLLVSVRWWFNNDQKITSEELTKLIVEHMEKGTIPTLMN